MKKINKNGFTLVELLGVIVILILILSIVLPKIVGKAKHKETEADKVSVEIIYKAAKLYLDDTVVNPLNGEVYCVYIKELINKDYLIDDAQYRSKKVRAVYNNGYSYSIETSCTPTG